MYIHGPVMQEVRRPERLEDETLFHVWEAVKTLQLVSRRLRRSRNSLGKTLGTNWLVVTLFKLLFARISL